MNVKTKEGCKITMNVSGHSYILHIGIHLFTLFENLIALPAHSLHVSFCDRLF